MTNGQLATNSYETLARRLLLATAEQWRLDPREVADLIYGAAFAHRCHPSLCIHTDDWAEHNNPCSDPPYPDGCRREIVRPGKTQCECETDPCPICPCGIHLGRCPGYRWDQEHGEAIPCPCIVYQSRQDSEEEEYHATTTEPKQTLMVRATFTFLVDGLTPLGAYQAIRDRVRYELEGTQADDWLLEVTVDPVAPEVGLPRPQV